MEKKDDTGLHRAEIAQKSQKTEGVWERRTADRRWGQNQLFGSFRVNSGVQALSQGDPTDSALAAIASILERPAGRPTDKSVDMKSVDSDPATVSPEDANSDIPAPAEISDADQMSETPRAEEVAVAPPAPSEPDPVDEPEPAPVDEYVKFGPGPLDAIRFKWTARPSGNGQYCVDETIGSTSRCMTSGPMPKDEAIRFIDERESDARRRFDALKNEMIGRAAPATDFVRYDGSED